MNLIPFIVNIPKHQFVLMRDRFTDNRGRSEYEVWIKTSEEEFGKMSLCNKFELDIAPVCLGNGVLIEGITLYSINRIRKNNQEIVIYADYIYVEVNDNGFLYGKRDTSVGGIE